MLLTRHLLLAAILSCVVVLPAVSVTSYGQVPSSEDTMLTLRAALVLTPEFCSTVIKKGSGIFEDHETYEVGTAACAELEPALKGVFSSLIRVTAVSSAEAAQVVLVPRLVDVNATRPKFAGSTRETIVMLEWTVKDASGRTAWIETVQGSANGRLGTLGSVEKNQKLIMEASVRDAAEQSARRMVSAPELRILASGAPTQLQPGTTPVNTVSKGCIAVQSVGSHVVRNVLILGGPGALLSKEQFQVLKVLDYSGAKIGDKLHDSDLQSIKAVGIAVVVLDKNVKRAEIATACH